MLLRALAARKRSGAAPQWWNPADKAATIALSSTGAGTNNVASQATNSSWASVRSVDSRNSGKRIFATTNTGGQFLSGFMTATATLGSFTGSDINGWGLQASTNSSLNFYHNGGSRSPAGAPLGFNIHFWDAANAAIGFGGAVGDGSAVQPYDGFNPATSANPAFTGIDAPAANTALFAAGSCFNVAGVLLIATAADFATANIPIPAGWSAWEP